METIVRIPKGLVFAREIICDVCNAPLLPEENDFFAIFWQENGRLFLEKYICEKCVKEYYRKSKIIPINKATYEMKNAIVEDSVISEHKVIVQDWNF